MSTYNFSEKITFSYISLYFIAVSIPYIFFFLINMQAICFTFCISKDILNLISSIYTRSLYLTLLSKIFLVYYPVRNECIKMKRRDTLGYIYILILVSYFPPRSDERQDTPSPLISTLSWIGKKQVRNVIKKRKIFLLTKKKKIG